ncbi:hypothetical protein MUN78_08125 [Leucobacter allii]|uniref:PE-PGRS family protein n=1 Tax=Leucobacter allii TaxID=2932247 RepID=A0ABY4FR76_9MICO|nr:hypothetical protein [Leucobacter allii]UOQ58771.1 hypothetical protein MUN78_08125 [Leucobacter allii]
MEPGDHWAYRARGIDPLVEVKLKRLGTQKPARVLVRFVGDDAGGREEWVPPARLKARWHDVDEFRAREARWEAVDTHPGVRGAREEYAVDEVMRKLIDESLAAPEYRHPGVTSIVDVGGLARLLQLDEALLRAEPAAFEEDGALLVPWTTTELIARRACELFPDSILREVDEQEEKARRNATHGETITTSGRNPHSFFIEPEKAAKWDAEEAYGQPMRDLLRQWCGQAEVERRDELVALREEVVRVGELLSEAIRALQKAGVKDEASSLERRFGVPLREARDSRR